MEFNLEEVKVFENYEISKWEEGEVTLETRVVDSSLNYYGNAHGGYLFTLCDQVSGLVSISTGFEAVTLQSNINYLRAGRLGDKLTVIGSCVHNGRTTKVVDVHIKNENGEMVTTAIFTMFVTGKREK
ncbi:PaaI family thioesterase [Streptococcus gallinaceus]|uniref:Acyl-CoA thioesterase n=1 Tax=Streptococcus gallinaceus TaxID=165758 RepID=A0ABV2JN26_9STRE|nr:PaaI family thioesterase [Streptococcus gallinaceus]MCP1640275.1 acyl-CoA thioesterase [Streptococcus gallinaceus]MCP1771058.1 acyl-CoA thioesterase [Streptococcus gallinaceus]